MDEKKLEAGPLFVDGKVPTKHVEDDGLWQALANGEATPEDQRYAAGWIARATLRPDDIRRDEIRIVFDGPPGPKPGRFVEVNDITGRSIAVGEWVQRGDYCELRIPGVDILHAKRNGKEESND